MINSNSGILTSKPVILACMKETYEVSKMCHQIKVKENHLMRENI